ncbi:MAG: hypothetical protein GX173_02280 [Ruminococcaceae bacterium]|nr:hypothetical protein [Oscillospiraceae bacterium]
MQLTTDSVASRDYLVLLEPWIKASRPFISSPSDRPDLAIYGTGYNSWGVQTQQKAFAAFAVAASDPACDSQRIGMSREQLLDQALKLLRFNLESHLTGSYTCTDGTAWGHTWISGLGIERMMHAVRAIEEHLSADDLEQLKQVVVSESDWLLDNLPIKAGPVEDNKPESNFWNGAILHRTALRYPDLPKAAAYREKGSQFMVNAISVPDDAGSGTLIDGRLLSEQHIGHNFFTSYALNHHRYMNLGYMVIVLSNIAMLYLMYREQGMTPPEALFHHVKDLWQRVKMMTFPDGRLMRVGGDTRVRYCYCQDYAIPMWLMMTEWLGDPDAILFEKGWLGHVEREVLHNGDGLFLSDRCAHLALASPLYYTRLESDRACALSMGAYWRRILKINGHFPENNLSKRRNSWHDRYHGACLHQSERRFASWTWLAAQRPQGLCLPSDSSDLAEWRTNLAGQITSSGSKTWQDVIVHDEHLFNGGFLTTGYTAVWSEGFIAEGQIKEQNAFNHLVFAALPDDRTVLVLQQARSTMRSYLCSVKGLFLQIPNDLFNGDSRTYYSSGDQWTVNRIKPADQRFDLKANWLNVEDKLGVVIAYSPDQLTLLSPRERQIGIMERQPGMLLADELCTTCRTGGFYVGKNDLLIDNGFILLSGTDREETAACARQTFWQPDTRDEALRFVTTTGADGRCYLLAANFARDNRQAKVRLPVPGCFHCLITGQTWETGQDQMITLSFAGKRAVLLQSQDID